MTSAPSQQAIAFGDFVLQPSRQALSVGGREVPLPGRSHALLMALLDRPGELIDKDELIARLWPNSIVERSNLRSQVATLRRLLGCGENGRRYIATISGHGYRFVAPVQRVHAAPHLSHDRSDIFEANLPDGPPVLFGRDGEIGRIASLLAQQRHVTLVGPGGIGKSALAIATVRRVARSYPDGVLFVRVDREQGEDAASVALSRALGIDPTATAHQILDKIGDRHLLISLDGCEATRAGTAERARQLLERSGVSLLVTSREPLDLAGEQVIRVEPLAIPEPGESDPDAILATPAAQLLRARMTTCGSEVAADAARAIRTLCRYLEGDPLAIEIAAGHADAFGVQGLLQMLDDELLLSMAARQDVRPRHCTLAASMTWSYELLSASEQRLLRELAVLRGPFPIESARAVASAHPFEVLTGLQRLVARSLLIARPTPHGTHFLLSRPAGAFAVARLREAGEAEDVERRHAEYLAEHLDAGCWNEPYVAANLGPALDAVHMVGAAASFRRLVQAALPYWAQRNRFAEAHQHVRRALTLAPDCLSPEIALVLQEALATILASRIGPASEQLEAGIALLALARQLERPDAMVRGHWALWAATMNQGRQAAALDHAREAWRIAEGLADPGLLAAADRMLGIALHLTGNQAKASLHIDRALTVFAWPERSIANLPFQFDQRVVALSFRARILLAQGYPEQAARAAAEALAEAEDIGHGLSIAHSIAIAGLPIALVLGRQALGERLLDRLRAATDELDLPAWRAITELASGWLGAARGEAGGRTRLRDALSALHGAHFGEVHLLALTALAEFQLRGGLLGEADETIEIAIARSESGGDLWCWPELLRIRALVLHGQMGDAGAYEVHELLASARQDAMRHKSNWWLLRIQIALARLGRTTDELSRLVSQIDEGRFSTDMMEAVELIERGRQAHPPPSTVAPRVMAA